MKFRNPLIELPNELYARHCALTRIVRELEDIASIPKLLISLSKIILGRGTDLDYKLVYYGAYYKESLKVKEELKANDY